MTTGGFSCSSVSKHSNCFRYDLEKSHVASLYSFEEGLGFGLDGGWLIVSCH